jgi:hypothetical protein
LAPNNDIENQFSSAVKSALDDSGPVAPPSETPTSPAEAIRTRRSRAWGVALLCLACTAIAVVVVVTVLQAPRIGVAPSEVEIAPMRPKSDSTAAAESTPAAASNLTTTATTPAPTADALASTASINSELQQPFATPSVPSHHAHVSRHARRPAGTSRKAVASAQTRHRALAAARASARGHQSALSNRFAKAPSPVFESRIPATAAAAPAAGASVGSASAPAVSTVTSRSVLVSSPDQSVYWALEDSGVIFRSTDRRVWQQQGTGVRSDLLAGEAPSNTVCWVVGRHGTILLTTDGKRWQRIKSPTNADIIGVSALSADVADIVAADGSHLSTFDRGSYWMPTI